MHNADNVGDYLISSRSLREYEAMFALTENDFRGPVLDCPGGASSFTVEASELGAAAVAVDPVYAMSTSELRRLVMGEPDRGSAHTAAGADRYLWDFYGDLQGHREIRRNAAALFADDLEIHPERYVSASLPVLPFEDGQFDLVLSSHSCSPMPTAWISAFIIERCSRCTGSARARSACFHSWTRPAITPTP
jgi:hypothetical protein